MIENDHFFKKINISENAYKKIGLYTMLPYQKTGMDLECYGLLLSKKDSNLIQEVIIPRQEVASASSKANGHAMLDIAKEIPSDYRAIGFWHSHADFDPSHSTFDDKHMYMMLCQIGSNNLFNIDKEEVVGITYNDYTIERISDNNTRLTLKNLSLEIILDNIEIKPDFKVSSIVKYKKNTFTYAYSIVTNLINSEPYLEIGMRELLDGYFSKEVKKVTSDDGLELNIVKVEDDPNIDTIKLEEEILEKLSYDGYKLRQIYQYKQDMYQSNNASNNFLEKKISLLDILRRYLNAR